ncbi:MAG: hypothetical protein P1U39_02250 [Legionellaceae bacterium]|nr:hypothetical protein [Legionellaceae bacterium]
MPIFHVVHTCPVYTANLNPGELLITLSDIAGKSSQLFIVEENTSKEATHYGRNPAPLLLRIGEIAVTELDEDILDELKAARLRLNVNHIGPLELSDTDAARILRQYTAPQSPTTVTNRPLSPVKLTSESLNIHHLMYHAEQNATTNEGALDKPLSPRIF